MEVLLFFVDVCLYFLVNNGDGEVKKDGSIGSWVDVPGQFAKCGHGNNFFPTLVVKDRIMMVLPQDKTVVNPTFVEYNFCFEFLKKVEFWGIVVQVEPGD